MNDAGGCLLLLFMFTCALTGGYVSGNESGRADILADQRIRAVQQRYAEWIPDTYGHTTLRYTDTSVQYVIEGDNE